MRPPTRPKRRSKDSWTDSVGGFQDGIKLVLFLNFELRKVCKKMIRENGNQEKSTKSINGDLKFGE